MYQEYMKDKEGQYAILWVSTVCMVHDLCNDIYSYLSGSTVMYT